jgi:predicted CXXCH cytochrome family protein
MIRTIYTLCLLLIISIPAGADQNAISLHTPLDKSVIEYDVLNMSLEVPEGAADRITVSVDGTERKEIVPDLKYECFSVRLKPGTSTVEVSVYMGDTVVGSFVRNIFRRSDLISEYRKPPRSFRKVSFHMTEHQECKECHVLESGEHDLKPVLPGSFPEKEEGKNVFASASTCNSCHDNITRSPFVHGPASVWSCLSCHNKDADPLYTVKQPVKDVCYTCHVEQQIEWNSKKFIHGPVNVGQCTICHSPHSSENAFNLFKSTWDLCVNCHAEKGTGLHVLGDDIFEKGHPTKGRKDPIRIGKELTCASCHNPHASNYPHLWAFEVDDLFELCQKCHFDK